MLQDADVPATEVGRRDIEAFDLAWLDAGAELAERVLIGWGPGTRAWSQWAGRGAKPILAWRQTAQDPPFPGFAAFRARISELPTFPQAWPGALEAVRGVYLLVSDTGEHHVGSASGAEGFAGRWRACLSNGHGGNLLLRQRGQRGDTMSILEIASPDMAPAEILARESAWKEKLGARAHGLNLN